MRFLLLSLTLFILIINTYGQEFGSVEGTITDVQGNVLPGVHIYPVGLKSGTMSNGKGYFKLTLPVGSYDVKFSTIGFETVVQRIEVGTSTSAPLTLSLRENLFELPAIIIERETMTGGSLFLQDVPGSAHYIGPRELQKFSYTDINRVLRNIPGVNLQEEDGFGLRPNIGMRGTGVERSSKITMMEDGILIAPAPYTAPAAYYFPTIGRMQGVEVRKGSSQVKYGPYTTGGAINFISTTIPQDLSVGINLSGGNFGRRIVQASVGQSFEHGGFVLETFQNSATGFKQLDNGGPTGFNNQDYLAKVRINTSADAKVYQALTFKIGQTTGDSDETYLGLTEADFNANPIRRYFGSQVDNIETEQQQYSLKYNIIPTKFLDVSITAYRNNFKRNWYKLDGVKYNTGSKVGITAILDDPDQYQNEFALLTGSSSPNADALFVRNNNRAYYAQGIQGMIGTNFSIGKATHDIEAGFRFHYDQEDRYQADDAYAMDNGVMKLTTKGAPGTESNRINEANAVSGYVQYSLRYGKFMAMPGLRYEKMTFSRTDYGKLDPNRLGTNVVNRQNEVDVFIPGVGVEYLLTSTVVSFAGIHRGFAPPGSTVGTEPEKSINYEVGSRFSKANIRGQAILFFNDYQNLLGSDLAAAGGGGTGDQFNAGKATIYGAEVELSYDLITSSTSGIYFPLNLAYTYTDGEFASSFQATNEDWGRVEVGDKLPYLSKHQLTLNAGIEHRKFTANISSKYNSLMRTSPGQGEVAFNDKIDKNFIVDLATTYHVSRVVSVFGSINNLFDESYLVARRPAGLRPGMPRSFIVGLKVNL